MADKKKRRGFLGTIGFKKKTPEEVFHKKLPPVAKAVNALPRGSTQASDLKQRIAQALADAKAGTNPKKALAQIKKEAEAIAKELASRPEERVISSPIPTQETVEKIRQQTGSGEAVEELSKHNGAVSVELDKVQVALGKLHDAVKQLDSELVAPKSDHDAAYTTLRREILGTTRGDFDTAAKNIDGRAKTGELAGSDLERETAAFKRDLAAHLESVKSQTAALVTAIERTTGSTEALRGLARDAKLEQDAEKRQAAYEAKVAAVDRKVAELENWNSPKAGEMRTELTRLSPKKPEDPEAAISALDNLAKDIAAAAKEQQDDYNGEAEALKTRLDAVDKKIAGLVIAIQLESNSDWQKAFNAQTQTEVKVVTTMIDNGANKQALAGAAKMIESLEARANDLADNLDDIIDLGEVKWRCRSVLENKDIKKLYPDLTGALTKEYETLDKSSLKMPASEAITKFNELLGKIRGNSEALLEKATARRQWLKNFKTEAGKIDKLLPKLLKAMKTVVPTSTGGEFFEEYRGPLSAKLEQARESSKQEEQASMDEADRLLSEITTSVVSIMTALNKKPEDRNEDENNLCMDAAASQEAGIQEHNKQQRDLATFKTGYDAFMVRYDELYSRAGHKPQYKGEFKAIKNLAKNAKDIMESSFDLDRANKVLDAAKGKMDRVVAEARMSYKKLSTIADIWTDALNKLDSGIGRVHVAVNDKVKDSEDQDLKDAAAAVGDTLRAAASFLKADSFNAAKTVYSKDEPTAKELARTREDALNKIRIAKEFIANDPLIRAAQANPFGETNVVSPVFAALRDLEYKVMITS